MKEQNMENEPKNTAEAAEEQENSANTTDKAPNDGKADAPKQSDQAPVDDIAALRTQLAEANDKYLRMLAEYDNFRRRSAKERQGVWADAVADTVKSLLPIADNLERAAAADGDADTIRHGLDLTLKSLNDMMKNLGVEAFGSTGEDFDPNLHNAVMHIDDAEAGENKIVEVFQRGWRVGEKIIRFAMVKVAN